MKNNFFTSNKYLNIRDFLLIIISYCIIMVGVSFLINTLFDSFFHGTIRSQEQLSGLKISFSYIISAVVTLFLTFAYRILRAEKGSRRKGVVTLLFGGKISALRLLWGCVLILSAQIVSNPLLKFTGDSVDNYYYQFECIDAAGMWGGLSVILVAPLFEEIFFRGVLLRDIGDRYGYFTAIILTSVTFGLIHFNLAQVIPALLSAFVFSYIFLLTKSIWMVISLHMLNNGVSYLLFNLLSKDDFTKSIEDMFTTPSIYNIVFAVAAIFLVIMMLRLIILCIKNNKLRESAVLTLNQVTDGESNCENINNISSEEAVHNEFVAEINDNLHETSQKEDSDRL